MFIYILLLSIWDFSWIGLRWITYKKWLVGGCCLLNWSFRKERKCILPFVWLNHCLWVSDTVHTLLFGTLVKNGAAVAYGDAAAFFWLIVQAREKRHHTIFISLQGAWELIISQNNRTPPERDHHPQPQWKSPDSPFRLRQQCHILCQ